jgi:N-terminal domain from the human glycogen debranching enzyme
MSSEGKTVSVTITYGVFDDSKLYRLKKSTVLRVVPGESLLGKRVAIQTNYPASQNDFVRNKFVSLEWFSRYGEKLSSGDNYAEINDLEMYCQVTMLRSGTFRFYILEEDR